MKFRPLAALAAACVIELASVVPVGAHTPTAGANNLFSANASLPWDVVGTPPTWATSAAQATLDINQRDPGTNNSKSPLFSEVAGGAGDFYYSGSLTSPCSGGLVWLGCANNGGTSSWNIYLRNLDAAPYHDSGSGRDWRWYDKTSSCPASGYYCFYVRRTIIHESIHVTMGVVNHDAQGEANTVMGAGGPAYDNTGWNHIHYQRCDEAAAQLQYDVRDYAGPYGDCFDHVSNAGVTGLQTNLTVTGTLFYECHLHPITVTGRLEIANISSYLLLKTNPLSGRTVWFDRDSSLKYSSTTAGGATTGDNWTATLTTGVNGTFGYTAHFDDASADGLADSNAVAFTVTWGNIC